MKRSASLTLTLISLFSTVVLGGCVTVKLDAGARKRADGVKFAEPSPPFVRESRSEVDAAWKNPKTGNVISYISDCQDPTDPPLEQITAGVLAGLADLKVVREEVTVMQEREGRRVSATGRVDGVPTEIDLLAFKRNHCIYILTQVGVRKSFHEDRSAFGRFIEGFRAP